MPAIIDSLFDPVTGTLTHILHAGPGSPCAVIDPVMGYDAVSGRTDPGPVEAVATVLAEKRLRLDRILETHVHADHLTAAPWLKTRFGGRVGIGATIAKVHAHFAPLFGIARAPGDRFDDLFAPGDRVQVGDLTVEVEAVASHTPADIAYVCEGHWFVGDTLFAPDLGTARCDFPGGDADALWEVSRRLFALDPGTMLHLCHDYPPAGRKPVSATTVAEQRAGNIHVKDGTTREAFLALRRGRDATLSLPALIIPSIQVNLLAGDIPEGPDGRRRIVVPVDVL